MPIGGGGGVGPPGSIMTNGTIIQLRRSDLRDVSPDGTVLYDGEIAINTNNRKLYTRLTDGYEVVEGIPFGVLEANQVSWNHAVEQTVILDFFEVEFHQSAKYFIEIQSSGATATPYYQAMEVIVVHNTINPFVTRYGLIDTNGEIAIVTVDIIAGMLNLKLTSNALDTNSNYVAKFVRLMHQV